MSMKALKDKKRLILGLGQTGLSVARFLQKAGQVFNVMDTREEAPGLEELNELAPNSYLHWNPNVFCEFDELVVSPGISISDPDIQAAAKQGVTIVGDIELFAQVNEIPVIAITGSNGKSTVTDLVATLIQAAGKKVLMGGNIGIPALDLVEQEADVIVLELSSFQLETTYSLQAKVATILNISEDHLDRYDSYQDYIEAKQRIYRHAELKVINHDDENTWTLDDKQIEFGLEKSSDVTQDLDWSFDLEQLQVKKKDKAYVRASDLTLQGLHNALNLTAAFALIDAVGIEIDEKVLGAAKQYSGLEHRCQLVCATDNLSFINDSKATNVGATTAAIESFAPLYQHIILIAGGDAKGADLSPLTEVVRNDVDALIAFGKDAKSLALLCTEKSYLVENMAQAVVKAKQIFEEQSLTNCLVLLSPACASLDMYNNYQQRGDEFSKLARALTC